MKTYIPLDRLKRSRDSGSALYNMHPTDVLGRAGGGEMKKAAVVGSLWWRSEGDSNSRIAFDDYTLSRL